MNITLFYPKFSNRGKAIIILRKTPCYIYCEIYNYHYEDGGCVFDNQLNINQKKYKITNLNSDEGHGIFVVKNIGRWRSFTFRDGLTLSQALGYHENACSNNNVDASI